MAKENVLITGNEAVVLGAIDAGAEIMFGYPITPSCEILNGWILNAEREGKTKYLQTEDEIAAGFGVLGAVLGGAKSFTGSAGPGHTLMQDPLSMAENMRLPFVGIMMQRGGPSTGTVNFSQQEVNLAAFGGNGDGMRIVYSASSVEEMYTLTKKTFDAAWTYRFPSILLGDGYIGKMWATLELDRTVSKVKATPILEEKAESTNLRNCYSSEESLGKLLKNHLVDWTKLQDEIVETEHFHTEDATTLILAHGLVAAAAKDAIEVLRKDGMKIGLWRPITINPIDKKDLKKVAQKAKKIYIFESSLNQFSRIVKYELSGLKLDIEEITKPAEGFTADEIINALRK
jgi:2-oxoglutarate ferredoxin oxidoreductase subunit alpha